MHSGILVVAAERELRRRVFDVLDRAGHPNIHTARDVPHAAILLEGRPALQLMIVVFSGDANQARHDCELLRSLPGGADTLLIGILAVTASLDPADLPPVVADWMHAPQVESELTARWHRAQAPSTRPAEVALQEFIDSVPKSSDQHGDYRSLFEESDSEWLIVDPMSHRVLDVSPAVVRHTRLHASQWGGVSLSDVLQFEGMALEKVLDEADRRWYPCQRQSSQGFDIGDASVRRIQHDGRAALALMFRSDRADLHAQAALSLLSRMFVSTSGMDAQMAAARLLFDEMALDYLTVWSAPGDGVDSPNQLLQLWRGDDLQWPAAELQSSLQRVLGGSPVMYRTDAQRAGLLDPLLLQLNLASFVGLPLYDERSMVVGAMLAGSRKSFADMAIIEPVLHCAAARFAQVLELNRTRAQGRAEGLLDALTGLPNRLLFNDRLDTILREAARHGECFAVLFIDLDRFKFINDAHGHAGGDEVLRAVTQRLRNCIRASDTVARYAGDEFVVVLRHIVKNDDVLRLAEKIMQLISTPIALDEQTELLITASMGVSFFPDDAHDAATLLKHADEAMYLAKDHGRNHFKIYEMSPEYARQHGTVLRSRLRHAEGNGELHVVYQPQVNTVTEDIVGMEALLRWEHPELGMISPAVFIPLAEETGLIVSMGEWVLRTACSQARAWELSHGLRLRLGVNLSAVQLVEPGLVTMVASVLDETGMDPSLLELEITESISIKAAPNVVENLDALHALGCHIAIDDFGTGAASLDYLRRLPADRIKIDQSFVRNIGVDPDDESIVVATIDMAHRLKRAVVAEGVETEEHLEFLRAHDCDELQGYLFCRPQPPSSFDKMLAERQRLLEVDLVATA